MRLRRILSKIFARILRRDIGRYDSRLEGFLWGFGIIRTWAIFHLVGYPKVKRIKDNGQE